jgi:hypothetical protein
MTGADEVGISNGSMRCQLNEARAMVERARARVAAPGVPSTGENDVINQDRE